MKVGRNKERGGKPQRKKGRNDAGCTIPAHAPKENTYCCYCLPCITGEAAEICPGRELLRPDFDLRETACSPVAGLAEPARPA
jgi:hypothetical protein